MIIYINTSSSFYLLAVLGSAMCRLDYFLHGKYCYYFSTRKVNWTVSKTACESHGSILSSISNEDELEFLIRKDKSPEFSDDTIRYLRNVLHCDRYYPPNCQRFTIL